jgi:hypothetical protein
MSSIEELKEVVEEEKVEEQKPKDLKDIMDRYGASQSELMEVVVTMFLKLDTIEKKLATPLLAKLLSE